MYKIHFNRITDNLIQRLFHVKLYVICGRCIRRHLIICPVVVLLATKVELIPTWFEFLLGMVFLNIA